MIALKCLLPVPAHHPFKTHRNADAATERVCFESAKHDDVIMSGGTSQSQLPSMAAADARRMSRVCVPKIFMSHHYSLPKLTSQLPDLLSAVEQNHSWTAGVGSSESSEQSVLSSNCFGLPHTGRKTHSYKYAAGLST